MACDIDLRFRGGAEILARGHGFDARVFPDESAAERWLHYGAPE